MANLKAVLKCWLDFDLPNLQKQLDETATETALRQDEADKGKKQLIELTKEWKRNVDENVKNNCATIIKAFQKEIDSLNKRGKAAENAFLVLYKRLLEIPDPVPSLKKAEGIQKQMESMKDLEMENEKLRKTLDDYHSEFAEVKNQEVTLNKLREKIKSYEEKEKENVQAMLDEKTKEVQAKFNEREQQLLDSKLSIATKLADAESKINFLNEELEKSRLEVFDLKGKHEEELMGRISEINLLQADIERAQQNLVSIEKYNESLKSQFSNEAQSVFSENQQGNEADSELIKSLEYQLSSKERELHQLMEEIHHLQLQSLKSKDTLEREIASLEETIVEKSVTITTLENKLKEQEDYEETKRELNVFKAIEFAASGEAQHEEAAKSARPLERLLLEKNKNLLSECTQLKVKNTELTGLCEELRENYTQSCRTVKEQIELIVQLENDVMNIKGLGVRGEGVGAANPLSDTELMTKAVQDLVSEMDVDESGVKDSKSLLPIISSQRERFRNRNLELEEEVRQQKRQLSTLEGELDTVRKDNVKLYEKIKFLQSYPNKVKDTASINLEDESVKRYSSQYEERIDPFAVFSRKEKQQRYLNLSGPEKVTLNMGRFILSNKLARTLVFFYTIILHLLVFVVLYKFSHVESCLNGFSSGSTLLQGVSRKPVNGYQG